MPKIAIIILNWNQPQLTISTIESFLKIKHQNFSCQIVVVDNGSTDNSILKIKKFIHSLEIGNWKLEIIQNKENLGYSGGNNLGIKYALKNNFDYVLVANNDIRVNPNFLQILINEIKINPKQILAPKIYFEKGYEFHKNRYKSSELGKVIWAMGGKIDWGNVYGSNIAIDNVDHGQFDNNLQTPDFISGCCLLTSMELFKDVGLFDKKYYLYLEDIDLSVRASKSGYTLKIIPNSIIWHINSGTAIAASNIQDYFITRNRLLFAYKYAPLKTKLAIFRESIKHLLFGRPWQKIGVRDYYLSKFGQGSWV